MRCGVGCVKFSNDLRNITDAPVDQMTGKVKAFAAKMGMEHRVNVKIEMVSS